MGTRNLTIVIADKKIKVAQYGQWDGYIEGNGKQDNIINLFLIPAGQVIAILTGFYLFIIFMGCL
jgi:hypothetical protein